MELVYLLIFLISYLIEGIDNVFLKKTDIKAFKDKKILFVSEEPSVLQCTQRCKFLDKDAIVDFKTSRCTCIKYEVDEGQVHQRTLTGVFVNHKIMKDKKLEPLRPTKPPQSTKPARTKVMNVALNKPAEQSTNYTSKSVANLAVDGSTSTKSTTKYEVNPWWSVDLKTNYDIAHMVFQGYNKYNTNKALIVETRQKDGDVWTTCRDIGDAELFRVRWTCENPTKARYIKIRSNGTCYIDVYEVEVYARVAA